jgi:hypothetical protein
MNQSSADVKSRQWTSIYLSIFLSIKIYDEINVYSRYIFWIYVDIFARTKINVYRQYLNIVDDLHYMFIIIRFDKKTKTILMTQIHFKLICNVFNVRTNLFVKKRQTILNNVIITKSTHSINALKFDENN